MIDVKKILIKYLRLTTGQPQIIYVGLGLR